MMKKRKTYLKALVFGIAFIMVLTLASCGGDTGNSSTGDQGSSASQPADTNDSTPAPEAGEPQYGGTLRLIFDGSVDTKQQFGVPSLTPRAPNVAAVPCLETLLVETFDGQYEPYLAESYEAFPDKKEVVFKIHTGIKFHDGSEMTAEIVAWNINRIIGEGSQDANYLRAEVRSDNEVALIMDNYMNSYENLVASHWYSMISKENYDKYGPDEAQNHPCGTGPFIVEKITPGESALYVKNPNYWQEGKPYLDAIEFVEIKDANTQQTAFMSATGDQEVDVLYCSSPEQAGMLKDLPDVTVSTRPGGPIALYPDSMNADSPLAKKEVREAISYAIDREAIVAARGFGINTPAYQIFDEGTTPHLPDSYNLPGYDPEKAKALLAEAGYPNGFSTNIWTSTAAPGCDGDTMEAVATMLRAVGIDATTEYLQMAEKNSREMSGWEGICFSTIRPFSNITQTFRLKGWDPDFQFYPSMWRDVDKYRETYENMTATPTLDVDLVQQLHIWGLEDYVHIPIYHGYDAFAVKDTVHNGEFAKWGLGTCFIPAEIWKEQ